MRKTHRIIKTDSRRAFLRAGGIGIALPALGRPIAASEISANEVDATAKRLVCVGTYLGYHTPSLFPNESGRAYQTTTVLKSLEPIRDELTLFSGLDHRAPNGHKNWRNFLTGVVTPAPSLDQIVADKIGSKTRYSSLEVTCGRPPAGGEMCFTREGVLLPMIGRPSVLYGKLFSSDSDRERMRYLLDSGRSVLDLVGDEATSLHKTLGTDDSRKLNEYLASLRDVEQKIQKRRDWLDKPNPRVQYPLPEFDPISPDLSLECETIMYDLIALALETDSTRVVSFLIPGEGQVFTIDGEKLSAGYHGLSHHGNDPAKIADFNRIGSEHLKRFAAFLAKLKKTNDTESRPLLDTTIVMQGSGMGDANTHNNSNVPIMVAGGGFRSHGTYYAIDRSTNEASGRAPLLGDLYVSLMQQLGLATDRFANASRNMNEYL